MFAGIGFDPIHDGEGLVKRVRELIDRARGAGVPVIYVQHNGLAGTPMEKGAAGWAYHREIAPLEGDPIVEKNHCDAFLDTSLDEVLRSRRIKRLVLVGAQSDFCVDTACRRAFGEGYEVMLVSDGHSTLDLGELSARQIIGHENRVLGGAFAKLVATADVVFD